MAAEVEAQRQADRRDGRVVRTRKERAMKIARPACVGFMVSVALLTLSAAARPEVRNSPSLIDLALTNAQDRPEKSSGTPTPKKSSRAAIPNGLGRSIQIRVEEKHINVLDSLVKVEGRVTCLSATGVVQYSAWIKTDYLEKTTGAKKEREETFDANDKQFYEVAAGKDAYLMASLGLADLKEGSVTRWQGKGEILVYATPRGQNGIEKRISNVIRVAIDFGGHKAAILQDIP